MDGYSRSVKPSLFCLIFIISAISISSCVTLQDPESSQENRGQVVAYIQPGEYAGQTIKPRRTHFDSLQLWLRISNDVQNTDGIIQFVLFEYPETSEPVYIVDVQTDDIEWINPVTIKFPPQSNSSYTNYYLKILSDTSSFEILGSLEDRYPDGDLYLNGAATDGDIAFRAFYKYGIDSFIDDLTRWFSHLLLIFPMATLILLPGLLIFKIINRNKNNPLLPQFYLEEKIAIMIAVSLSVIPIFFLWFYNLGIKIDRNLVILFYVSALLFLLWLYRVEILTIIRGEKHWFKHPDKTWVALLIIFFMSLVIRLIIIRDLSVPPWVDSVHHSLMTRMIIEQGGLPSTYLPYINISPVNYHSGFHTNLAVLHYLTGIEIPYLMLIFGQLLNALTVFAVYLFTTAVIKDKLAGLISAFITGMVNPMPAYYTSWGRYTQLIGILIFSAALALILSIIQNREKNQKPEAFHLFFFQYWKTIFIAVLACAGLFLSHYRVGIFLGCFFGSYFAVLILREFIIRIKINYLFQQILIFILVVASALLLTFPWWPDTLNSFFLPRLFVTIATRPAFQVFHWSYLTASSGKFVLILGILGLLLGFLQRKRFAPVFILWIAMMFAFANLHALPLPGGGLINNTSVLIFLFIPISAAGGYLISESITNLSNLIPDRRKYYNYIFVFLTILFISIVSVRNMLSILNLQTILLLNSDLTSLKWIKENVPENEVILINNFPWAYSLYAGSDGGYWISPISGRQTIPPPLLYGFDRASTVRQDINKFLLQISRYKDQPDILYDLISAENIKYIYTGTRGGMISPQKLLQHENFKPIFEYNGTWVIQLVSENDY